ncbi:hypothetical protein [Morganella morganii]
MEQKLNKRELKYLAPAVLYGWRIEKSRLHKQGRWDGDYLMPVTIGSVAEKLISLGLLEKLTIGHVEGAFSLRLTNKGYSLRCRECHNGWLYDNNDEITGKCPVCDGIGVVNKTVNEPKES